MSNKTIFLKERALYLKSLIKELEETIAYAKTIGFPTNSFEKQIKSYKKDLLKKPNPTEEWLLRR